MFKCQFLKNEIEYIGNLISGKEISPKKHKVKAITNLAPATNISEVRHILGLVCYYRKSFPMFSEII